jgi:TolB protein
MSWISLKNFTSCRTVPIDHATRLDRQTFFNIPGQDVQGKVLRENQESYTISGRHVIEPCSPGKTMNTTILRTSRSMIICFLLNLLIAGIVRADEYTMMVSPWDEFSPFPIAVPPFETEAKPRLADPLFSTVIMNDLEQSGLFRGPDNPKFAEETHQLDLLEGGEPHYTRWSSIGVFYLIRGSYTVTGKTIKVVFRIYDTVSRNYIFGYEYDPVPVSKSRYTAHRISDDIVKRVMDIEGVARTKICFVRKSDPPARGKQICVMESDGYRKSIHRLTQSSELAATPCWGLYAGEILYTTYRDYNPDLEGLILETGQRWFISRQPGFNLSPSWLPQKKRICLTLTKDGNSEIYTMGRDGRKLKRLTRNPSIDSSPDWSPDGNRIVFQSDRSGTPQLYVMNYETEKTKRLTYNGKYNDDPTWSPADDDLIAYSSRDENGIFQICTIRPDGSDFRQLTHDDSNNEDPSWSPNGLLIAFTSEVPGNRQIFSMFKNGEYRKQLTFENEDCHSPAWSPFRSNR